MNNIKLNIPSEILKKMDMNKNVLSDNCCQLLKKLEKRNLEELSQKTGTELVARNKLKISFFENKVIFDRKQKELFCLEENKKEQKKKLDTLSSFFILHYLYTADGTSLTNEWIPYRELPDGLFYWETIPGTLSPLIKKFERCGNSFVAEAKKIGGEIHPEFRYGAVIYPFRMFPVLMVFYEKDEEFDADLRIFFDRSAPHYLKTDVIKVLLAYIVNLLK